MAKSQHNPSNVEFDVAAASAKAPKNKIHRWILFFKHRHTIWSLQRQDTRVLQDLGIERYAITDYVLGRQEADSQLQ
ncbi:MAG: hypothetical protein AAF402_14630 [Pseudomonadota bacterium]